MLSHSLPSLTGESPTSNGTVRPDPVSQDDLPSASSAITAQADTSEIGRGGILGATSKGSSSGERDVVPPGFTGKISLRMLISTTCSGYNPAYPEDARSGASSRACVVWGEVGVGVVVVLIWGLSSMY